MHADEACAAAPELLGEVQRRWENCRLLEAELNCLFPSQPGTATDPDLAENDTAPSCFRRSPATRWSRSWAAEGWAWCTRPAT